MVDLYTEGIREKGSEVVVSAICYTIYTMYLSLCAQPAETTSPELFLRIPPPFFFSGFTENDLARLLVNEILCFGAFNWSVEPCGSFDNRHIMYSCK